VGEKYMSMHPAITNGKKSWYEFMKVGIIHFMIFPSTMKGEGPIVETISKIANDDFFTAIEISWIKDDKVREEAKNVLEVSGLTVGYGAQPVLLSQKLSLNHLDETERQKAIAQIKACIDEANYMGIERVAVLAGPDPGDADRDRAFKLLVDSLDQLCTYAEDKGMGMTLETFDREIDKRSLIGPSDYAVRLAEAVKEKHNNFGLLYDLSHAPLLGEKPSYALPLLKDHLVHIHIGNCAMRDKEHPAYGDMHPHFGIKGGENGVDELAEFLRVLFEIGYFDKDEKPIVSFEVMPLPNETSELVIANSKRTLREAWLKL